MEQYDGLSAILVTNTNIMRASDSYRSRNLTAGHYKNLVRLAVGSEAVTVSVAGTEGVKDLPDLPGLPNGWMASMIA